jgi:hypothetical protein
MDCRQISSNEKIIVGSKSPAYFFNLQIASALVERGLAS